MKKRQRWHRKRKWQQRRRHVETGQPAWHRNGEKPKTRKSGIMAKWHGVTISENENRAINISSEASWRNENGGGVNENNGVASSAKAWRQRRQRK
jgi:hypothetical protein